MKICRFRFQEKVEYGVLKEDQILPIGDFPSEPHPLGSRRPISPDEVKMLTPVEPSKIVCIGRNYADHAKELGNEVPEYPLLFLKAPSALIMSGEDIVLPKQSKQVEHEGELAVIIGRECKNLPENVDPLEHVLGYLCLNDVTARDLQRKDVQFTRAKSFDTFCPVGGVIETEIDPADLSIRTRVNGEIKQDSRTSKMVFDIPFLVRYISNQMTLYPGDLIATGTPSGVSMLRPGDVCEVEIEGLEILRNTITK